MTFPVIPTDVKLWATIKLTPHFSLKEALYSGAADSKGMLDQNIPDAACKANILTTLGYMEIIRNELGRALLPTSLFRAEVINKLVGGSSTSAHRFGLAVDHTAVGLTPRELAAWYVANLKRLGIPFDQIILEFPGADNKNQGKWVHLGFTADPKKARGQILTAKINQTTNKTVYVPGLV